MHNTSPALLPNGHYLGTTVRARVTPGIVVNLATYSADVKHPSHVHENPGFFFLLTGQHREVKDGHGMEQPTMTAIFHKRDAPHATEIGPRGMFGVNVAYRDEYLASIGVDSNEFVHVGRRFLPTAHAAVLRLASQSFLIGACDAELEMRALELLTPLVRCREAQPPKWLKRARSYIVERSSDGIRLELIAKEVGVHPIHLAKCFRKFYGCSISEFLQSLRLTEAMKMVLHERSSVGEAAVRAGFSDHAHLSHIFRRVIGCSPKEMRRLCMP